MWEFFPLNCLCRYTPVYFCKKRRKKCKGTPPIKKFFRALLEWGDDINIMYGILIPCKELHWCTQVVQDWGIYLATIG